VKPPTLSNPQKLSAYVLWRVLPIAIVVMGVIGMIVLSATERTVQESVAEHLDRQSEYVAERIGQRLDTVLDQVTSLAKNDLVVNGLIDTQSRNLYLPTFFASLRLGGELNARISLVDYKGREIFSNNLDAGPLTDAPARVNTLAAGREVYYLGSEGMLLAVPVLVGGLHEGAIAASFPPDTLSDLFDAGVAEIEINVVGDSGTTVYFSSAVDSHSESIEDRWIEQRHSLPYLPGVDLVTAQHEETAFRTIYQLRAFLIYSTLLALVALVAAIVYSTYLSSRELRALSSILGRISRPEHLDQRVDATGPSELRALGNAFNTMLETLQQTTTSRSYLDNILNSLNELLIVTTPGGEIITLNLEAERFLASRDMTKNASIATAIRADRYGQGQDPWEFLRVTGALRYLECVYERENAPPTALLWAKSSLRDDDDLETGVVYVGTDITERIEMEHMKTEFVSTVSHELRTPLTSILGSIKLVQSGAAGAISDKSKELLGIAQKNSERLVRLINDILDIQKIEAGQMTVDIKPLELGGQIEQAIAANDAYAEQLDVSFRVMKPEQDVWVMADTHRLDQILANLFSNAAKFSKADGEVLVSIECEGGFATVSVADSGIGIPEEYHDAVFDKFKQVDASDSRIKGGTGLGLSITKNLVEMMDGDIWFDSEPGKGTVFHVRFTEVTGRMRRTSLRA